MCSSRCVTSWEICATIVVTELENGTQKQEERTKNRRNAITTVLSRSSCNCSDGKRMCVALWVRVFALCLFDGKHWDMGERNMENLKQGQQRHSCRWEKGCSTNSAPYPMGTSCDTHGTAAESCWWHTISLDSTLLTWVAMCCHAWLLLPHTKHVQLHVIAAPLLHQFPRWLNLKSTQLFHPPLLCWWCWYWKLSIDCLGHWKQ